jgi:hypothetical protein
VELDISSRIIHYWADKLCPLIQLCRTYSLLVAYQLMSVVWARDAGTVCVERTAQTTCTLSWGESGDSEAYLALQIGRQEPHDSLGEGPPEVGITNLDS